MISSQAQVRAKAHVYQSGFIHMLGCYVIKAGEHVTWTWCYMC